MTIKNKFATDAQSQRLRLIKALKDAGGKGVTSYYAIQELGIYYPPARINELRKKGYRIITEWENIETDDTKPRRVARYVLMSSFRKGVAA